MAQLTGQSRRKYLQDELVLAGQLGPVELGPLVWWERQQVLAVWVLTEGLAFQLPGRFHLHKALFLQRIHHL